MRHTLGRGLRSKAAWVALQSIPSALRAAPLAGFVFMPKGPHNWFLRKSNFLARACTSAWPWAAMVDFLREM